MNLQHAFLKDLPQTNQTFEDRYYEKIRNLFKQTFSHLCFNDLIEPTYNLYRQRKYYLHKNGIYIYSYSNYDKIWTRQLYDECKDDLKFKDPNGKTCYLFAESEIENLLKRIETHNNSFCVKYFGWLFGYDA